MHTNDMIAARQTIIVIDKANEQEKGYVRVHQSKLEKISLI